jgi:hypothetical protein
VKNITFKKTKPYQKKFKWAIEGMQLKEFIKDFLRIRNSSFPEGKQLSSSNAQKYYWLEVLVKPKILFYEDPTDTWMTSCQ